jgi:serine/threonine-protein kinase HipA
LTGASATVCVGAVPAGTIERTRDGSRFSYLPAYLEDTGGDAQAAVSLSLPLEETPVVTRGVNLHPFFAGLLPEGIRMRALVRSLKASEDDLLGLLLKVGGDCVGAVSVVETGAQQKEHAPIADVTDPSTLDFQSLFEKSIDYGGRGGDVAIAGEQRKVSAAMISLPLRSKQRGRAFILKLQPDDLPRLLENEHFFMSLAREAGLRAAPTRIITDRRGRTGLLVQRFDRDPGPPPVKLAQEDGCQLLERYPADKYRVTMSDLLDALEVCSAPRVERLRLLELTAFSYLIANGDLHAKNVSVLRGGSGLLALSPAYDVLSTLPYGDQTMALDLLGRDRKLRRPHFVQLAGRYDIPEKAVSRMLDELLRKLRDTPARLREIGLSDRRTRQLEREMESRARLLA